MYNDNYGGNRVDTNTAVFYIIVVNIIFFLVSQYAPDIIPYGPGILTMHYPASEAFRPFQIFTHMFMHANFMHILLNMYGLYMFGSILERVWGTRRFTEFYFMTGLGAMALYTAVQGFQVYSLTGSFNPSPLLVAPDSSAEHIINSSMLGASGAVFGVLTAFAMLWPNTELFLMFVPIPIKAKYAIGGYVVLELFLGIRSNPGDNVAHFAHLGGALIGFIIVKIWNRNRNILY
jgi:rhomboid-like protein